ncbi:hypothetical protein [Microlunatus elymi]|nr:hypothetical protein [Microlunatus elymi]
MERDLEAEHRLRVEATMELSSGESVASFGSAAVMHDLPIWSNAVRKVHLTRNRVAGGRIRPNVHLHVAPLGAADVAEVDGIPVTSLARTFVDHARTVSIAQSVAAGDMALRLGMDLAEMVEQLEMAKARRGVSRARHAAALLDADSESAGESISRVVLHQNQVPRPELQVEILGAELDEDARVDFLWREYKVIGEFDGKIKYGRLLRPGETPADAVIREKIREDRLRDLGYIVVRWIWDDLWHPQILIARIERAFARAGLWV